MDHDVRAPYAELLTLVVDFQGFAADHCALAHAPADQGRVRARPTARGENPLRCVHAVNVLR